MSGNIFGLIRENKMAAIANFCFYLFIFHHLLLYICYNHNFSNFRDKLTTIRGCLKTLRLEHVCMCVHWIGAIRWAKYTFGPLQQILFYINLSNFQYNVMRTEIFSASIYIIIHELYHLIVNSNSNWTFIALNIHHRSRL